MSESQWLEEQILERFEVRRRMGSGAYGVVWEVVERGSGRKYALKKNFDAFQNSTDAQRTYREITLLQQVQHPNMVQLREVIRAESEKDIYLLFELMEIDLHGLIKEGVLGEQHKQYIAYQLATAFHYLHSAQLIHRDIKPSNVLLNQDCHAKVCDFGLVRSLQQDPDSEPRLTEYIATRWYRAPEILLGSRQYSKAADVWSFGCLLGELLAGKAMFPGHSTLNQIERVLTWTGPPTIDDLRSLKTDFGKQMLDILTKIKPISRKQMVGDCSGEALDLLSKTLSFNPEKRPTFLQIAQHPYLRAFYNRRDLVECSTAPRMEVSDNTKLTLHEYRRLVYKIVEKYEQRRQNPPPVKLSQLSSLTSNPTDKSLLESRGRGRKPMVRSASKNKQSSVPKNSYKESHTVNVKKYSSYLTRKDEIFRAKHSKTEEVEPNLRKKVRYYTQNKKKSVSICEGRRDASSFMVRQIYQRH